jgi:hypothetical protein
MLIEPISQAQSKYMGCASHSDFQNQKEKVLDADTIGTLLNIVEKDCDRLTVLERQAYRKAKTYERRLRQSKDGE